ncbi:dihydropteridine reductase [Ureibacillus massiliensis 4400831 = CIP 108448 = CCUG 49529]|uniref:Flavohemoprotein n=1 Tax=Ureibacillus massiliensis 4400831 = CIP 108448 = CCUG 49529 TaxID=1211035 RepID=A0A0A3JSN3_9BACL|nr:NO-inducible flavohemoprotein [Ureibacillus massiliensis]KGR90022.1 dihydropteridine reductase [Ureibacillus massiliensis 4400831 = CIP 108448 = CCUG 49529]
MLSQQTIDVIKSTVPVLEQHGVTITKTFYSNMLNAHPELLNYFNRANQQKGRQQTALANTVLAAAKYIDNLEPIVPVVMQIAHKHRGLGILPEHYPIVGENLLRAIKEVLGDAATDEIIDAWANAYGVIAEIFISVEEDLYKAAEDNGGWRLFKPFKVAQKVQENEEVTSFYLVPEDGSTLPAFQPGQYITVRVKVPGDEYTSNRHYTLSQASNPNEYRISVKREDACDPKGVVSNYLHNNVNEGDFIDVSAPAGLFTLSETNNPTLFISGGIGVTPLNTMLQAMEPGRDVTFVHTARNKNVIAFQEQIENKVKELNGTYRAYYSDSEGYITKEVLAPYIKETTEVYVCGPAPFMETVISLLNELNVPKENIHFEFFGPAMTIKAFAHA